MKVIAELLTVKSKPIILNITFRKICMYLSYYIRLHNLMEIKLKMTYLNCIQFLYSGFLINLWRLRLLLNFFFAKNLKLE